MKKPSTIPLLFLSLSLILVAAAVPVRIGVVLDGDSPVGMTGNLSIRMAVSDFYAAHPNYTTRLDLRWRNSKGDVVAAASAVVDLLKNEQAQAIIGPRYSGEAEFAAEIGNRAHVPIISFSATSPSISNDKTPYFLRTSASDSSQAKAIAAVIKYFGWKQVVPVYENSDYGSSLIPHLIDAVMKNDCRVPYRSVLPATADDDQIEKELYWLMTMQTRVFVVHMRRKLAARLFAKAKAAEMVADGFAWIISDGLTSLIGTTGDPPKMFESMQGVLGVKTYVPKTQKLEDFRRRWRREFLKENADADMAELSTYGLRAYDTVWALAMAVESAGMGNMTSIKPMMGTASNDLAALGVSATGQKLIDAMSSTRFTGISGEFRLSSGQLKCTTYEIVNVIGEKERGIGFWTEGDGGGLSRRLGGPNGGGDGRKLGPVIWPGESVVPKGWVTPVTGNRLRIAVPGPVEPGFQSFLNVEKNPMTNETVASGFVVDVFEAAVKELPYAILWKYETFQTIDGKSAGNYDDLLQKVFLEKYDAVVGDVTITANRSHYVDFTLPYTTSGVSMVVPNKDDRRKNAWIFLRPLTKNLWVVSGAFFVFTGIVVWVIEHRDNDEFQGKPAEQIGAVLYFSFSTLVFAHREKVHSNLSKIVVVVWLFVVLILQSSYTASLTSMLTVQQLRPTVAEIEDLKNSGERVGYLEDSFVKGFLVSKMGFDKSKLIPLKSPQQYAEALAKGSKNDGVAAVVDEIPYLRVFLKDHCYNYTMAGRRHKTGGFGFVFPRGSPIVPDLSRAILQITEDGKMTEIEKRWFGDQTSCSDQENPISSNSLDFGSFWGLFLITGIASTAAFSFFLLSFLYERRQLLLNSDEGNSLKEKVKTMAREFDQKDPKSRAFRSPETPFSTRHSMASPFNGSESSFGASHRGGGEETPQAASGSRGDEAAVVEAAASAYNYTPDSPFSISSRNQGDVTPPPEFSSPSPEPAASVEMTARGS